MPLFIRILWTVGADFVWAGSFLVTWFWPYFLGPRAVHQLVYVMLMEFLVVHSTGFFTSIASKDSPRRERVFQYVVLGFCYCLFALGFSAGYGSLWPFFAFFGLVAAKAPMIIFRPLSDDGQMAGMAQWAAMTTLYLFGTAATLMMDVPPLGITPEVIASQNFGVGGEWPEKPYIPIAFGVLYFTGMGLVGAVSEFFTWRMTAAKANAQNPKRYAEVRRAG